MPGNETQMKLDRGGGKANRKAGVGETSGVGGEGGTCVSKSVYVCMCVCVSLSLSNLSIPLDPPSSLSLSQRLPLLHRDFVLLNAPQDSTLPGHNTGRQRGAWA